MTKKAEKTTPSKKVEVYSLDPWNVCAADETIELWGIPFTWDGKNMVANVSKAQAEAMKAAGRVK